MNEDEGSSDNGRPDKIVILNGSYSVNASVVVNSSNSGKVYLTPNGTEETDTNISTLDKLGIHSSFADNTVVRILHSNLISSKNQLLDLYEEPYLIHQRLEEMAKDRVLIELDKDDTPRKSCEEPFEVAKYVYIDILCIDDHNKIIFDVKDNTIVDV